MILIISALEIELNALKQRLESASIVDTVPQPCYQGTIAHKPVILAQCGVGKVNAAALTATLLAQHPITSIINTGCAGGAPSTNIGDMVIGTCCMQHDVNVTPLGYEIGEIPDTGRIFNTDNTLSNHLYTTTLKHGKSLQGMIISGDTFISQPGALLFDIASNVLAVDMESAAIAQVAYLHSKPFAVVRAISDKANTESTIDFPSFVSAVSELSALSVYDMLQEL